MAGPRKCKGCGGAVKGHQGPVGMGKCKNSPVESEQIEQEDVPQAEADHVISGASEQEASEPETAKKTKGKPSSKSSPTDSPDITGEKTASKPGRKKREEKEVEMVDEEVVDTASEKVAPTSKRGKKAAKKVEEDQETEESTDPAKNELAAGDKAEDSDTEDRDGEQRAQPEETSEDLEPNKSKRGRKKKMSSDLDESDAEKENKEPSAETPVKETKKRGKAKKLTKDEKEEEIEEREEEKEEGAEEEEEEVEETPEAAAARAEREAKIDALLSDDEEEDSGPAAYREYMRVQRERALSKETPRASWARQKQLAEDRYQKEQADKKKDEMPSLYGAYQNLQRTRTGSTAGTPLSHHYNNKLQKEKDLKPPMENAVWQWTVAQVNALCEEIGVEAAEISGSKLLVVTTAPGGSADLIPLDQAVIERTLDFLKDNAVAKTPFESLSMAMQHAVWEWDSQLTSQSLRDACGDLVLEKLPAEITGSELLTAESAASCAAEQPVLDLLQSEAFSLQHGLAAEVEADKEAKLRELEEEVERQKEEEETKLQAAREEAAAAMEKAVQEKARADEEEAERKRKQEEEKMGKRAELRDKMMEIFDREDISFQKVAMREDLAKELGKAATRERTMKSFTKELDALDFAILDRPQFEILVKEWVKEGTFADEARKAYGVDPFVANRQKILELFDRLDDMETFYVKKKHLLQGIKCYDGVDKLKEALNECCDVLLERQFFVGMVNVSVQGPDDPDFIPEGPGAENE